MVMSSENKGDEVDTDGSRRNSAIDAADAKDATDAKGGNVL